MPVNVQLFAVVGAIARPRLSDAHAASGPMRALCLRGAVTPRRARRAASARRVLRRTLSAISVFVSAAVVGARPAAAQEGTARRVPNAVRVHASDYAFAAPARIPAGMTRFDLVNDGPALHHLQIVRLDSGRTVADLERALHAHAPLPQWAAVVGGPNAVDPGGISNATLDVRPGNYALVCFVADGPGAPPHFAQGMLKALTVTPAAHAAAAAPVPDIVLTLRDYGFDLSRPLVRGRQTVEVRTAPNTQPHEAMLFRLAPGKTGQQVLAWLRAPGGPSPARAVGGVTATTPAAPNYFTADLAPGEYLLICMVPDATDGRPHFMHGMMRTVTVH